MTVAAILLTEHVTCHSIKGSLHPNERHAFSLPSTGVQPCGYSVLFTQVLVYLPLRFLPPPDTAEWNFVWGFNGLFL